MLYRYRIYDDYTILYDETTASYSNGDVHSRAPTTTTEKSLRSSAFYTFRTGGSRGHQVHTECTCTWLLLKDDFCHWNEWEKSTFPGLTTFSAEMTGAKALWLSIQIAKAKASAKFQFQCFPLVSYRHFWRIFAKSRKLIIFYTFG